MNSDVMSQDDLSSLAIKVAIQIDQFRQTGDFAQDYILDFMRNLRESAVGDLTPDFVKALAPSKIGVVSRALGASSGKRLSTAEEVSYEIKSLFDLFSKGLEKNQEDALEKMIIFCLALHDELLEQGRVFDESRRPKSELRV